MFGRPARGGMKFKEMGQGLLIQVNWVNEFDGNH